MFNQFDNVRTDEGRGVIEVVLITGNYDILYEDGSVRRNVSASLIRRDDGDISSSFENLRMVNSPPHFGQFDLIRTDRGIGVIETVHPAYINGVTYDIGYETGDSETYVPENQIRARAPTPPPAPVAPRPRFSQFDLVHTDGGKGNIQRVYVGASSCTYDVEYETGAVAKNVPESRIRPRAPTPPPAPVAPRPRFSQFDLVHTDGGKGNIQRVYVGASSCTYDVEYETGAVAKNVPENQIRIRAPTPPVPPVPGESEIKPPAEIGSFFLIVLLISMFLFWLQQA